MAGKHPTGGNGAACGGGDEAIEAGEYVGDNRMSSVTLQSVLVRFHITAAQNGTAVGDSKRVKHAIAVEQVVGPTGKVLRVRAVTNIRTIER